LSIPVISVNFFSGRIEHAAIVSTARARITICFIVDVVFIKNIPLGVIA
jgi:hypothetical protein